MKKKNKIIGWAIFSLFVWLHLIQVLLPLPSQREAEIHMKVEETERAINYLLEEGVDVGRYSKMNKEELKRELSASYWALWIKNITIFLVGILATFFLYKDFRVWPFLLGLVSFWVLYFEVPPIVNLILFYKSFSGFLDIWLQNIGGFYAIFIWPGYSLVLFGLSLSVIVKRMRSVDA